ncbi:hypothetical protein M011DRAFT_492773 [Sporormia fimetaria CBS 119925]|uniref:Uncharacterized protein n=1 Tax=Sporormia fimetaria CBS 119925 TaxID=1340428 RepID=A0A6A6VJ20_9PLEO|nr:hypothetical protein M011DRAFT_492773 [Sporormia fimetaria CBS 119925]
MDTMSDPLDASTVLEESTIIAPDNNEFVQHSLLLHDTLLSSQIYPGESQDSFEEADSLLSEPSYIAPFKAATPASSFSIAESGGRTLLLPPHLVTVPLSDLPTARHLRSIYPQTPTPTFLCVLTEDVQVREVFVRKGGYKMDLYEAIVADHTRSGFKVSFWYKPNQARDQIQEGWRMSLEEAKVGDVLLLRNIVLNAFRDQVFGQSLNSSITKARTAVDILWRADGLRGYRNISPSSIDQDFRRVKKWAQMHIVPAYPPVKKRKSHRESSERSSKKTLGKPFLKDDGLPPDTME